MVESTILNLANKQLKHLDLSKVGSITNPVYSLILDDNQLEDVWESFKKNIFKDQFVQLSLTRNRLRGIQTFVQLKNLRVLSLCGNKIISLNGFDNLPSLEWLSVSGNHLTDISGVTACKSLVHLDVSDNEIKNIPQISSLHLLHTLLLHGNMISLLQEVPSHLPLTLAILSLAENKVDDFSQVQYISAISNLEQLSIMKNPCVEKITVPTSYRPLVVSWCKKLNILDGVPVTQRESMAAEWVSNNTFKHNADDNGSECDENKENIDESCDHAAMRYSKNSSTQRTTDAVSPTDQQTTPARYRVSDKEKRKRVHAWLGAQVGKTSQKEKESCDLLASKSEFIQGSVIPQSPARNLSANKTMYGMPVSAFEIESKSYRDKISSALQMSKTKIQKDELASKYSVSDAKMTSASAKLYTDEEKMNNFGTKDDFCYVFDSTVARTYAKKYSNSPGKMNELSDLYKNHSLLGDAKPQYSATQPTHARFTSTKTIEPFSLNTPNLKYDDASATKYEEYDRRPIKPLSDDLQSSMYRLTAEDQEYMKNRMKRSGSAMAHTKKMKAPQRSRSLSAKDTHDRTYRRSTSPNIKQTTKLQSNIKKPRKSLDVENVTSEHSSTTDESLQILPVDLKHVQAATRIQALWRGYRARRFDQTVIEVRQEVRSRRAEQYISFLCHEVQLLKDRLETEHKMRDLQTEAIRYIWSHVRPVIKHSYGGSKDTKTRKFPEAKRGQRSARSPRQRSQGRFGSQQSSPRMSPCKVVQQQSVDGKSISTEDFGDETESSVSTVPPENKNKKIDASWKDDVVEVAKNTDANPDDTDEGRGTIVTDGEGNILTSSAEDNDHHVKSAPSSDENKALRNLVGDLQDQVLQLQEAMIVLSSKLLPGAESTSCDDIAKDDETVMNSPSRSLSPVAAIKLKDVPPTTNSKPSLSLIQHKSTMSTMSLHDVLATLNSPLSESELWAVCEQTMIAVNKQRSQSEVSRFLSLESVHLRKDGRIQLLKDKEVDLREFDEMYLAPESINNSKHSSTKAAIFSASVVLWSAADWNMDEQKAPNLSETFEQLLVAMSHDDETQRANIDDVIKMCEDYHAEKATNSLAVCSSVFADAINAQSLKRSGFKQSQLMNEINSEKINAAKTTFRDEVVPEINSVGLRPTLKPAAERVLSPRPLHPPSPRERLLTDIQCGSRLKRSQQPKMFTVREMFEKDPELIRKINILPGQRRKNVKAMRMLMCRATPCDPTSGPRAGIPTAPRALRVEVKEDGFDVEKEGCGLCSVVLRWHTSKVFDKQQNELNGKIIGYRIYVNGHAKGMVAGNKTRALLEGLRKLTEYRVHIRAVSDLGESDQSNTVIAHITATDHTKSRTDGAIHLPTPAKRSPAKPRISPLKEQDENKTTSPLPQPRKKHVEDDQQHKQSDTLSAQLGAVFPCEPPSRASSKVIRGQVHIEKVQQKSSTEATIIQQKEASVDKAATLNGDDVIDRVLRRYGINQIASIVPSFASGSSLPPFTINSETIPKLNVRTTHSVDDLQMHSRSTFQELDPEIIDNNGMNPDTTLATTDITPRSQALLAQLKDDLLN